jgi:hypothetical protein
MGSEGSNSIVGAASIRAWAKARFSGLISAERDVAQ